MADNIVHTTPNNLALKDEQLKASLGTASDKNEPSSGGASSTLSALGPVTSESYPADKPFSEHMSYPSGPATPGDLFPGAFPKAIQSGSLNQDAEYVKDAASNALETAKDYMYSAGEVVGGYLPKSVAAYFPNYESPKKSDDSLHHTQASSQKSSIVSESVSETLPGPGHHGKTLEDAHIPEEVGITGTRIIEEHGLVAQTPIDNKSDNIGPRKPEHNTLAPPNVRSGAVSTSSKQLEGASTNASTRSLAGCRVDTWSHIMPASSTNETHGADMRNTDGTMKTSSSAADNLQHNFSTIQENERKDSNDNADRPEFEHHPEETHHINAPPVSASTDKSAAPHITSPTTTGREHLTAIDKSTKARSDSKPFAHQDSLGSTVATPGHDGHGQLSMFSGKGKEREHFDHSTGSATETGAYAGSVVTGIDTSASPATTKNVPTTDAGAWAATVVAGLDTPAAHTANNNSTAHPTPSAKVSTIPATKDLPDTPDHHDVSSVNSKTTKSASPTKPKFMDKVRGEIKILSGKLEHSEEKIEEGRRLMGKPSLKH